MEVTIITWSQYYIYLILRWLIGINKIYHTRSNSSSLMSQGDMPYILSKSLAQIISAFTFKIDIQVWRNLLPLSRRTYKLEVSKDCPLFRQRNSSAIRRTLFWKQEWINFKAFLTISWITKTSSRIAMCFCILKRRQRKKTK